MKTNNSILMFVAGAVTGIAGVLLIPDGEAVQSQELATAENTVINNQLEKITSSLNMLNEITADLQNLVQKYTYVMPSITTTNNDDAPVASSFENNIVDSNDNVSYQTSPVQTQDVESAARATMQQTIEDVPATQIQIEEYHSIETRLYAAANNKSVNLYQLIQDANQLTRSQRLDLTNKTMQMIKNGEISPAQFTQPSES